MNNTQCLTACEPDHAARQPKSNPPYRILVVEDDIFLRQLNIEALIQAGYEVNGVEDGAAAWQALNADRYDLLITDNNMPRVSGIELLKHLRAVRMELPVIMATGTLPTEEFSRHPWLQPAATLLKPYTIEDLRQTVEQVLLASESSTAPRQGPARSTCRILAVDGDHDLRTLYAEALAGIGCEVHLAGDGRAAWEAIQAKSYRLLITEHELPNLTGVELVAKLRTARMALPVVMAAGRLPVHELARNPSLQLAATLLKPFALNALLDTVKSVLRAVPSPDAEAPPPYVQTQPTTGAFQF